ncbi:MAG: alpha/beta hydrolase family protein [Micromonosporaceae bacterium]
MHGFPGYERNLDLAQVLRRAGYAALVFDQRGVWGTAGSWSIAHMLEDSARVVAVIRTESVAVAHRLDGRRVAVLGHSLGEFAALMTAAADLAVAAVISVVAVEIGAAADICRSDPAARSAYVTALDGQLLPADQDRASGEMLPVRRVSGESLVAEAEHAGPAWRLTALGPRLAHRPVLLIAGSRDTGAPAAVHYQPLVDAYRAAGCARLEHHLLAAGHDLSSERVSLARTVLGFLGRNLPSK